MCLPVTAEGEFGVILPHTGPAQAIRTSLAEEMIPHQSSPVSDLVTISIGIASRVPDHKTTAAMVIGLADEALYQSKNKGRDTITLECARPAV